MFTRCFTRVNASSNVGQYTTSRLTYEYIDVTCLNSSLCTQVYSVGATDYPAIFRLFLKHSK